MVYVATTQVPGLDIDRATFFRVQMMPAQVRAAEPTAFGVRAVLVLKDAFEHEDFLAAIVGVGFEHRARRPAHQGDMFRSEFMQRQHTEARHQALAPRRVCRIDDNAGGVGGIELPQLDKDRAAIAT